MESANHDIVISTNKFLYTIVISGSDIVKFTGLGCIVYGMINTINSAVSSLMVRYIYGNFALMTDSGDSKLLKQSQQNIAILTTGIMLFLTAKLNQHFYR